jgi:abhydrolase domain-containing protein 17
VRIKVPVQNKLFFDMFPNIDRIERVQCPVFIIHGKSDEVVPVEHGGEFLFFLNFQR